jgi:hypothetical protein
MKILFLGNDTMNNQLFDWLVSENPYDQFAYLCGKLSVEYILKVAPDLVVSYCYPHIITAELLRILPEMIVNLHISLLPFNRGADPNVWSAIEKTPAGVTIHLIDKGVDTGDILYQEEVSFDGRDVTLRESYDALQSSIQLLFQKNWSDIRAKRSPRQTQNSKGTLHRVSDLGSINDRLLGAEGWDIKRSVLQKRYFELTGEKKNEAL